MPKVVNVMAKGIPVLALISINKSVAVSDSINLVLAVSLVFREHVELHFVIDEVPFEVRSHIKIGVKLHLPVILIVNCIGGEESNEDKVNSEQSMQNQEVLVYQLIVVDDNFAGKENAKLAIVHVGVKVKAAGKVVNAYGIVSENFEEVKQAPKEDVEKMVKVHVEGVDLVRN